MRASLRKEVSTVWRTMTHLMIPESLLLDAPASAKEYVHNFFDRKTLEGRTYLVAFLEESFEPNSTHPKGVAPCHLLKSPGLAEWIEQKINSRQIIRTRLGWDNNELEVIEMISRVRPY